MIDIQITGLQEVQKDLQQMQDRTQNVTRQLNRSAISLSSDTLSEEEMERIATPAIEREIAKQTELYISGKTRRFSPADITKRVVSQLGLPIEVEVGKRS